MSSAEAIICSVDTDLSQKHVVTACSDHSVRIYNLRNKELEHTVNLLGHSGPVTQAKYINQGELLASSDFTGKLIIWKLEGGTFSRRVEKQVAAGPIYDISVRFNENKLQIFCGCDGGVLKTLEYDQAFNETEKSQEAHRYGVSSVSANSEYLVTGGLDFSVALHTLNGNDQKEYFKHHDAAVNCVAVAPSNHTNKLAFASVSEDGLLVIYQKRDSSFEIQKIDLGQPGHSLSWSKTGFSLTVGYGSEEFKSYILGENGLYEEVEMKDISK